ncbi:MAG TPA: trypsin-like serine protease [Sediminispirochaeta sp.]|nr:trypsin-like serine protease [Sediminispirochaeta sp.]
MYIFTACAGTPTQYDAPGLYEVSIRRVEDALGKGNISGAIQDYFILERRINKNGNFATNSAQIEMLGEELRADLVRNLEESLEGKNYERSLTHYFSIQQLGWLSLIEDLSLENGDALNRENLIRAIVRRDIEQDRGVRGLSYLRYLDTLSALGDEELELFYQSAIEEMKYPIARRVLQEQTSRGLDSQEEPVQQSLKEESRFSHGQLIRGTVTVWVNRGIKVQGGVGRPDRVIGSGFYVDRRGYILTNYHVISSEVDPKYEGYSRLYVRPSENPDQRIPARVIGFDPVFDVALLKVERSTDTVLSFSSGEDQAPGDRIYAIGSPGGLENSITSGIVSAVKRRFLQLGDVIQVDVPINQGNSGGPLLDEEGNLIGIVFAGIEQFEGVNFAVPVEWLAKVFPKLYERGEIEHPYLGISLQQLDEDSLEISYVVPGSPAYKLGLEAGEELVSLAGEKVSSITEAQRLLLAYLPGTVLSLTTRESDGDERTSYIAVAKRPETPLKAAVDLGHEENLFAPLFGMQVERVKDSLFRTSFQVTKVYRGGVADESGMSVNDPFSVQKWDFLPEDNVLLVQLRIKKRKAGFLETGVQLGAYISTPNIL